MFNTAVTIKKQSLPSGFGSEYYHKSLIVKNSLIIHGEKALVATSDIAKDIVLFYYKASCTELRTRTSIQVGRNQHIEAGVIGSHINHSCMPSSRVRTSYDCDSNEGVVAFFSIRNILKGEEITFDYATTETDLTPELANTLCLCETRDCRGRIFSYNRLPYIFKEKLEHDGLLAEHILEMFS
jgi:hypothetical protein